MNFSLHMLYGNYFATNKKHLYLLTAVKEEVSVCVTSSSRNGQEDLKGSGLALSLSAMASTLTQMAAILCRDKTSYTGLRRDRNVFFCGGYLIFACFFEKLNHSKNNIRKCRIVLKRLHIFP